MEISFLRYHCTEIQFLQNVLPEILFRHSSFISEKEDQN